MNGTPHTHDVKIKREYEYSATGGWEVVYGDTTIHVCRGPLLQLRLTKAIPRAVRRHDQGSIRAEQIEQRNDRIKAAAVDSFGDRLRKADGWASQTGPK